MNTVRSYYSKLRTKPQAWFGGFEGLSQSPGSRWKIIPIWWSRVFIYSLFNTFFVVISIFGLSFAGELFKYVQSSCLCVPRAFKLPGGLFVCPQVKFQNAHGSGSTTVQSFFSKPKTKPGIIFINRKYFCFVKTSIIAKFEWYNQIWIWKWMIKIFDSDLRYT